MGDSATKLTNRTVLEHDQALARAQEREKRGEFASLAPPEQLVPFSDWDYYYTKGMPARWAPNPGQPFKAVTVPAGFVTDLTSIPQGAWSLGLRPEGRYAFAAIVHDYLYWIQDPSWNRETADKIFLFAMEDSKVPTVEREAFYGVLRAVGGHAWDANAKMKRDGERRFLKKYPPTFTTTWKDWKATPGVFED